MMNLKEKNLNLQNLTSFEIAFHSLKVLILIDQIKVHS